MNKKRILITILVILVIAVTVCLIVIFAGKNNSTYKSEEDIETTSNESIEKEVENEIKETVDEDETTGIEDKKVDSEEATTKSTEETKQTASQEKANVTTTATNKPTIKQDTVVKATSTPVSTSTSTPVVETNNEKKVVEEATAKPTESTKQEKKPEVTYKTNYQMIEKIKQSIVNNESEYMKEYGYTIVVDSSIKSLTNPFTYTELRVKKLIKNSFGTIKIYAEDYCLDGEVMWTDSYIL